MPLTPVYTRLMDEVPAPMQPALPDPTAASPASPTVYDAFAAGNTSGVSYALNKNNRRNELTAALGGGAIGVGSGCELTDDHANALTINLSAGYVNIGGWIKMAATSLALANGARSHLWLSRTGDLSARTDLTQPATSSCYLGSVLTAAGDITEINYSGRERMIAIGYRRTGDAGEPNEDMPSWWVGIVRTTGGIYWWDGADYTPSADAFTVLTSNSHATSGALEDLIDAAGSVGVTITTVDVGGGVYKIRFATDSAPHTEGPFTATLDTAVDEGHARTFRIDFSGRGAFAADDYHVAATPDVTKAKVRVLGSNREGDAFDVEVICALDASGPVTELEITLTGPGYTATGTPTAAPTVTEHDANYTAEQAGAVTLTDAATIATDASLGNYFRVAVATGRTLGAPTNPTDTQKCIWEIQNTDGSAQTLTLATGAGGFLFGSTITALTDIAAGKRDLIGAIYHATLDRWLVCGYAKGF